MSGASIAICDALTDRAFFGALLAFRTLESWRPWLSFLRAVYGHELHGGDLKTFRACTGREAPREGGYPEAVAIVGRQSGKTQIAAVAGVFEAARAVLEGQRGVYVPLVAQDLRGAQRALLGYVSEAIEGSELLSREVVRRTTTEIELAGRVTIGLYPCRPAAVRGIRTAHAVVDELAFFIATDGRPTDTEMLGAVRPSLATTGGRLLILWRTTACSASFARLSAGVGRAGEIASITRQAVMTIANAAAGALVLALAGASAIPQVIWLGRDER